MKEEDLKKHLDNILIDGLIKEAEQDNADFEAAMRHISDEDFEEIVMEPAMSEYEGHGAVAADMDYRSVAAFETLAAEPAYESIFPPVKQKKSKFKIFRPWITAIASSAAVIAIVLIPSINAMNGKLCDSALYMSESYITASKGGLDLSTATNEEIKAALPEMEKRYESSISVDGKFTTYSEDFPEAAWDLAVAYLKLHKKSDAVEVLKTLESQTKGTSMGNHCEALLKQLD